MKNRFFVGLMLLSFSVFGQEKSGDISVTIPYIKAVGKGKLIFILHSEKKTFPGDSEGAYRTAKLTKFGSPANYVFKDVPFGVYAISIHQDKDENGWLNFNFFGLPSEPVGVSKMNWIGYPRFSKSKFTFREERLELKVKFLNN